MHRNFGMIVRPPWPLPHGFSGRSGADAAPMLSVRLSRIRFFLKDLSAEVGGLKPGFAEIIRTTIVVNPVRLAQVEAFEKQ